MDNITRDEVMEILMIPQLYKKVNEFDAHKLTKEQRREKLRQELFSKDLIRANELGLNKFKNGHIPQRKRAAATPQRKISVILQSSRKGQSQSV